MKRALIVACFLLACVGINFAQTAPAKKEAPKTTAAKPAQAKPAAPAKKDGTPDMRYKANKAAAADTTKHMKKNGTPDKRYKENKKKS
jgi:hypothetical protein